MSGISEIVARTRTGTRVSVKSSADGTIQAALDGGVPRLLIHPQIGGSNQSQVLLDANTNTLIGARMKVNAFDAVDAVDSLVNALGVSHLSPGRS